MSKRLASGRHKKAPSAPSSASASTGSRTPDELAAGFQAGSIPHSMLKPLLAAAQDRQRSLAQRQRPLENNSSSSSSSSSNNSNRSRSRQRFVALLVAAVFYICWVAYHMSSAATHDPPLPGASPAGAHPKIALVNSHNSTSALLALRDGDGVPVWTVSMGVVPDYGQVCEAVKQSRLSRSPVSEQMVKKWKRDWAASTAAQSWAIEGRAKLVTAGERGYQTAAASSPNLGLRSVMTEGRGSQLVVDGHGAFINKRRTFLDPYDATAVGILAPGRKGKGVEGPEQCKRTMTFPDTAGSPSKLTLFHLFAAYSQAEEEGRVLFTEPVQVLRDSGCHPPEHRLRVPCIKDVKHSVFTPPPPPPPAPPEESNGSISSTEQASVALPPLRDVFFLASIGRLHEIDKSLNLRFAPQVTYVGVSLPNDGAATTTTTTTTGPFLAQLDEWERVQTGACPSTSRVYLFSGAACPAVSAAAAAGAARSCAAVCDWCAAGKRSCRAAIPERGCPCLLSLEPAGWAAKAGGGGGGEGRGLVQPPAPPPAGGHSASDSAHPAQVRSRQPPPAVDAGVRPASDLEISLVEAYVLAHADEFFGGHQMGAVVSLLHDNVGAIRQRAKEKEWLL